MYLLTDKVITRQMCTRMSLNNNASAAVSFKYTKLQDQSDDRKASTSMEVGLKIYDKFSGIVENDGKKYILWLLLTSLSILKLNQCYRTQTQVIVTRFLSLHL